MAATLFILSILAFLAAAGSYREGIRTEGHVLLLVSAILFADFGVVAAINGVREELTKRFPRTPTEKMVAHYYESGAAEEENNRRTPKP